MLERPANVVRLEVDVVVAGSGSAGMTAAIVAAHGGLDVLLVEKTQYFGGTAAWSGGGCWIPGNALMGQIGIEDSREAAVDYASKVVGNYLRRDLFDTFLDNGPRMLEFMFANTQVRFAPRTPAPDYDMEAPGALMGGRSLGSVPYDARALGENLKLLNPPLTAFNAPWGMMMSPLDLMQAQQVFKKPKAAWYMAKLFARYAADKVRFGRGTRLTMGNALAARLLRSALDAKITLWPNTAARRLVVEDGRVTGLVVRRDGQEVTINARKGVVLACGGFSGSPEMRKQHFPFGADHVSMVSDANTGDGLNMAMAAGAILQEDNARNASYTAVSTFRERSGFLQKCPHFFTDVPKPGCIAVNVKGERFGDESGLQLGAAMNDSGSVPAWLICDKLFIHRYGLGLVYPFGIRLRKMRRAGYLHEGKTLTELAAKIRVDAAGLEKTVARNNEFAKTGIDLDFGKGSTPLGRSLGDPAHKPNPCIGPIVTAPFYAVRVVPGDVSSSVGLEVNTLAQPVDAQGDAIPGLYVCGLDMNSLWSGTGFANGAFHAQNMTFGVYYRKRIGEGKRQFFFEKRTKNFS